MDNQRLLVWSVFGALVFLTWQAWLTDYGPQPVPEAPQQSQVAPSVDDALPTLTTPDSNDLPAMSPQPQSTTPVAASDAPRGAIVKVTTDVLDIDISTLGATLVGATLTNYPIDKDQPDVVVELLSQAPANFGALATGVQIAGAERDASPTEFALFEASRQRYELGAADELLVPFVWTGPNGQRLTKQFRFRRGSYVIDVEQTLVNSTAEPMYAAAYARLKRVSIEQERSMFDVDSYSFVGPIFYDGSKSEKLDRDDLIDDGPLSRQDLTGAWAASIQHHFLSAIVPPQDTAHDFEIRVANNVATATVAGPTETIAPGGEARFETTAFVGPKLQAQLEEIDETLKLTVDYGWLTMISNPLFWVLSLVYGFVANWGVAIIVVTILIKLVFYKLTEASGRSMAKMREIQPRMKALQERYKDDRQALGQAMMDLYKREKVNPAAGCLPILIQMPFFLAFYWVLLESVEMRQAPFALWITDLSSRDPFFILPLIMGAAMLFQQKLNPAPADPVQARVMQIMPIMFTVFFAFFPSGLVLYWVTNTLLSIAQQWHINRVVAAEAQQAKRGGGKKKSD